MNSWLSPSDSHINTLIRASSVPLRWLWWVSALSGLPVMKRKYVYRADWLAGSAGFTRRKTTSSIAVIFIAPLNFWQQIFCTFATPFSRYSSGAVFGGSGKVLSQGISNGG